MAATTGTRLAQRPAGSSSRARARRARPAERRISRPRSIAASSFRAIASRNRRTRWLRSADFASMAAAFSTLHWLPSASFATANTHVRASPTTNDTRAAPGPPRTEAASGPEGSVWARIARRAGWASVQAPPQRVAVGLARDLFRLQRREPGLVRPLPPAFAPDLHGDRAQVLRDRALEIPLLVREAFHHRGAVGSEEFSKRLLASSLGPLERLGETALAGQQVDHGQIRRLPIVEEGLGCWPRRCLGEGRYGILERRAGFRGAPGLLVRAASDDSRVRHGVEVLDRRGDLRSTRRGGERSIELLLLDLQLTSEREDGRYGVLVLFRLGDPERAFVRLSGFLETALRPVQDADVHEGPHHADIVSGLLAEREAAFVFRQRDIRLPLREVRAAHAAEISSLPGLRSLRIVDEGHVEVERLLIRLEGARVVALQRVELTDGEVRGSRRPHVLQPCPISRLLVWCSSARARSPCSR